MKETGFIRLQDSLGCYPLRTLGMSGGQACCTQAYTVEKASEHKRWSFDSPHMYKQECREENHPGYSMTQKWTLVPVKFKKIFPQSAFWQTYMMLLQLSFFTYSFPSDTHLLGSICSLSGNEPLAMSQQQTQSLTVNSLYLGKKVAQLVSHFLQYLSHQWHL